MSEKDKKPPMQEKPFHDGYTKSGKLSRLRKLGIILTTTSVAAMLVIVIFSLVSARSGSGFIIDLDTIDTASHFTMALAPRKDDGSVPAGKDVLVGEPLGNAWTTTNKSVREYYDAKFNDIGYSDENFSGSWNLIDEKHNSPLAMLFTFYLNNISETEEQTYRVACRLNSELADDSVGNRPYDYVRLALFEGDYGSSDDSVRYFGARNTKGYGSEEGADDTRECLANWQLRLDKDANYYRVPVYNDYLGEKKISYCEAFNPGNDRLGLFDVEGTIKPGSSRRITFLAYLEGEDPDCDGSAPKKQKLGFSLHIGV